MKGLAITTQGAQLVFGDSLVKRLSLQPQALDFLCRLTGIQGFRIAAQRIDGLLNQRLAGLDYSHQGPLHALSLWPFDQSSIGHRPFLLSCRARQINDDRQCLVPAISSRWTE